VSLPARPQAREGPGGRFAAPCARAEGANRTPVPDRTTERRLAHFGHGYGARTAQASVVSTLPALRRSSNSALTVATTSASGQIGWSP